jgi:hypothetical protein
LLATGLATAGCDGSTPAVGPDEAREPGWYEAADMDVPREHPATLKLTDGRVFAAGGHWLTIPPEGIDGEAPWITAEIYDPLADTWHAVDDLPASHGYATAIELSSGHVMLAGGFAGEQTAEVELLDVHSGTWSAVAPLSSARQDFTLDLLPDGRVLAVGGFTWDTESVLPAVELFDPALGTWTPVADLPEARSGHVTFVTDDALQVVGGCGDTDMCSVLRLDLDSLTWSAGAELPTMAGAIVSLGDGRFLSSGGRADDGAGLTTSSVFSIDGSWEPTGDLAVPRSLHWLTLLPDGTVVAVGGSTTSSYETTNSVEIWNPATGQWTTAEPMAVKRQGHRAAVLDDGELLVIGGYNHDDFTQLASCERFAPPTM